MNLGSKNRFDGDSFLKMAAATWYLFAVIGLSAFFVYVISNYGAAILSDDTSKGKASFIAGDTVGNAFLLTHLSLALVVISGGLLQLLPSLRTRFPGFHRWNGRIFLMCAIACSLAGQYLIFTREIPGNLVMDLGTSSAGLLVLIFSVLSYRTARAKRFSQHRKWAMRLFLVANAGWFFRIGLMLWLVVNKGPVGIDMETFTGPALVFISYAQFLLPLAMLELYLRAQASRNNGLKLAVSGVIFIASLATLAGVGAASAMMWFG
jgi:hypothetical protein